MGNRSQLEVKLPLRGMLDGFIVIFALLILSTAATHFIPAGTYQRRIPGLPPRLLFMAAGFASLAVAGAIGWGPF